VNRLPHYLHGGDVMSGYGSGPRRRGSSIEKGSQERELRPDRGSSTSGVGPSRRKSMSARMSAFGSKADVLVTFANDASDPTRTSAGDSEIATLWNVHARSLRLDVGGADHLGPLRPILNCPNVGHTTQLSCTIRHCRSAPWSGGSAKTTDIARARHPSFGAGRQRARER